MENLCHKCGTGLEEGTPFCPQCGAPQIRVAGQETEDTIPVPQVQPNNWEQGSALPLRPAPTNWLHSALPSVVWAGLIATLIMLATRGALGLGMLIGGFVTVVFYRRRNPEVRLTTSLGARLGAVTGAVGYGVLLLFLAISVAVFHTGGELRQALNQAVQQAIARTSDPQAQQALQSFHSTQGLTILLVCALILMLVLFVAISSAGGALGAFFLRNKRRPAEVRREGTQELDRSDHSGNTEDHQKSFK